VGFNKQTDLVLRNYARQAFPTSENSVNRYLTDELQRLETTIRSISDASIQVAEAPPTKPRRGTVRFSVLPWDPLADGSEGLVVYNGTAWVAV
jgi:hypothetical protein